MTKRFITILLFGISILLSSCRTEESEFINVPEEDTIKPNSITSNLLQRVASNDGSIDNIVDKANCFSVKYPITVSANAESITLQSDLELNDLEAILDKYDDDSDTVTINFPITIITTDFAEQTVETNSELENLAANCNGENVEDADIECVDFNYPIEASIFNTNSELFDIEIFTTDKELFEFVGNINESEIVNFDFPISVMQFDGTNFEINSLSELRDSIETNLSSCNEDDDYDYDDDDCNDCTVQELTDLLTNCPVWTVENLERDSNNTEDIYVAYTFEFDEDGTIEVYYANNTNYGTWTASGSGNNITVEIDIPNLPDCNNSWRLHEIRNKNNATECDLNLASDKLRYISNCNADNIEDDALVDAISSGSWYVSYYFNDTDLTNELSGYTFNFNDSTNWINVSSPSGDFWGYWRTLEGDETDIELSMNFSVNTFPIEYIVEDWDVVSISANTIMLRDISTGDGTEDLLTLEKL